jgi:uroporphyrinogen decarboxylase
MEKAVRLAKAGADMIGTTGDFTYATGFIMSPEHFREFLLPQFAKMVRAVKDANPKAKYFVHSDGNLEPAFEDLIDIGVDVFDPIQPECMDVPYIKKRYGDRIVMHGMIPVQTFMQKATVDEVKKYIRNLADTVCVGGGAILTNSNRVQWDIPLENTVAVYEELLQKKILKQDK